MAPERTPNRPAWEEESSLLTRLQKYSLLPPNPPANCRIGRVSDLRRKGIDFRTLCSMMSDKVYKK